MWLAALQLNVIVAHAPVCLVAIGGSKVNLRNENKKR
jgi:hypothetical protein